MEWTGEMLRLSLDGELDSALLAAQACEPRHSLYYNHTRGEASASGILPLERTVRHSIHGVDESVLLAEAEDLFATLDAAAFAARTPNTIDSGAKSSWTAASSPVSACERAVSATAPSRMKRRKVSPQSSPQTESDTSTPTNTEKKSAPSWRDKVREEITQLRSVATKLEVQLLLLEQQSRSSTMVRTTRVQIWKRLAERQMRLRELALADNAQLKAMMVAMLHAGDRVSNQQQHNMEPAMRLPNYLLGPRKEAIAPPRDAVMANVFAPLLARLDASYAEMDAVFRENGMSRSSVEPNSYMQRKTRRLGQPCRYIELGDKRTLPFPWRTVGNYSWQCNRTWHLKDSPYKYPCVDRPSDTFAVNYRVTHKAFGANESVDFKLAVRRYVESDQLVVVYACQSDGEKELAGVTVRKVGWVATRDAQLAKDAGAAQPVSTVQSCMHVFLDGSNDREVRSERVNRVVNLMLCAFEEDVVFINQNVDNQLLEDARTRSARITAIEAFPQQHIAPPVPRVQLEESATLPATCT